MNLEELEEALNDILPEGFEVTIKNSGEVVIKTNLVVDEATDELVSIDREDYDDDPDPDADELDSYEELDEED